MTRKEAIKIVRNIYQTDAEKEALAVLVPELKEGEDERIIRFFAELATDACGGPGQEYYEELGLNYDKVMTWLEKRKGQKSSIFPPGFGEVRWNPISSVQQKSAKWDELQADFRNINEAFENGKKEVVDNPERYGLSQPVEWSEEDEKMLQSIIKDFGDGKVSTIGQEQWLKALRPQPKAELTLLDKNIINAAVAFVEQNNHFNSWGDINKHTVIKALRSLKPHWKPSKEQMEALEIMIRYGDKESIYYKKYIKAIKSLYEKLEKL